jgi:hypothetical protein
MKTRVDYTVYNNDGSVAETGTLGNSELDSQNTDLVTLMTRYTEWLWDSSKGKRLRLESGPEGLVLEFLREQEEL